MKCCWTLLIIFMLNKIVAYVLLGGVEVIILDTAIFQTVEGKNTKSFLSLWLLETGKGDDDAVQVR